MKKFSDFNIKVETNTFIGDKIKISKVLNKNITVHAYKIVDSKFTGMRVDMQIEISGVKHVLWSGSKVLMDMIQKVPNDGFPFETVIVEDNERYMFT